MGVWLSQGWVGSLFGIIGIAVSVVSIGVAIWFYKKSKKYASIKYMMSNSIIIASNSPSFIPKLEVRFGGVIVPDVQATTLTIWNDGSEIIDGSDIVSSDKLRFHVGESGKILQVAVQASSRATINPSAE